jgi:hypothetical protein
MALFDRANSLAKLGDMLNEQGAGAVGKIHGEEIGTACRFDSSVLHDVVLDVGVRVLGFATLTANLQSYSAVAPNCAR